MTRLELLGNGSNSVSNAVLIGRELLEVSVDGIGRSKLLLSGTPQDKEVVYDAAVGSLLFNENIDIGTQIIVLYQ